MHADGTEHAWSVYYIQDMGVWMPALTACDICRMTSLDVIEAHIEIEGELPTVRVPLNEMERGAQPSD